MISPDDADYRLTKRVKQGRDAMHPTFQRLAQWTAETFSVPPPLNILYETIEPENLPRLQLVFEHQQDSAAFYDRVGNYDENKQSSVATAFAGLLDGEQRARYDLERMFVIFTAFEPVARFEANDRFTSGWMGARRLEKLRRALGAEKLWKIYPEFDHVVFFVHADAQCPAHSSDDFAVQCRETYAAGLDRFDEFGYFRESPVEVEFSSRESFERDFEGNWSYFAHR